jgi:hypothetical protein
LERNPVHPEPFDKLMAASRDSAALDSVHPEFVEGLGLNGDIQ